MKKIFLYTFLIPILFTSCEKVIDIDLNNSTQQTVIEANISNIHQQQTILISKTGNFSESNSFTKVSAAVVTVLEEAGATFTFVETSPGTYLSTSSFKGIAGKNYTLNITAQAINYTAQSKMPIQISLDTLLVENVFFAGEDRIIIKPQYKDPQGLGNYYYINQFVNGKQTKAVFVYDDRFNDGGIVTRPLLNSDDKIKKGDTVTVELQCIDFATYKYYVGLKSIFDSNQFNSATPSNPPSNINNNALGYFAAHTVHKKTIIIP